MAQTNIIRNLIRNESLNIKDVILIESPFSETTRAGVFLQSVQLALTSSKLILAVEKACLRCSKCKKEAHEFQLSAMYPLEMVALSIFKNRLRQTIKATFYNGKTKYFELSALNNKILFWKLWCRYITEINKGTRIWPYSESSLSFTFKLQANRIECIKIRNINDKYNIKKNRWTDKYTYLGTKRELEDQERPIPIPGLGPSDAIKLSYLKPQYFGCWDQTEHWVQCSSNTLALETRCDYEVYTYTGEPTSNVTYTSLMTTWK